MNTILVQMAEPQWTLQALHLACAMGCNTRSDVALLKLLPVQYYTWLGTALGYGPYSPEDSERAWKYKTIAADYAVDLAVEEMQYVSLAGALLDAAERLDARVVFAQIPQSSIRLWRGYQIWDLRRQLAKHDRTLYTLDRPVQSVTPSARLRVLKQRG